jgi:S-adenosylmethionine-diacylglycerol 3-amino-3-carboxypropyl transferase
VDRQALQLTPADTLLVITSAGCNVLDYALTGPKRIHAVDANPRQTALLELKLAGIRQLQHGDFFKIFGAGGHPHFRELYYDLMRYELSPFAQSYWDRNLKWFSNTGSSFYYRGLSGTVARMLRHYLDMQPKMRDSIEALFDAPNLDHQRNVYDSRIKPYFWTEFINWTLSRQFTMSMLGVPHPQRKEVQAQHAGGVAGFVRECIEYVARELPLSSNYFYSVYIRGTYTPDCCPEYLKPENFALLKAGYVDRIVPHTTTVTQFLRSSEESINKYVLLDHMDWMAGYHPELLVEEWEFILRRASPDARLIFRSAHERPRYLDAITIGTARRKLADALHFYDDWARELTRQDRVHTYAGFHIADLQPCS